MERHYADIAVIDHTVDPPPFLSLSGTSFGRDVRLIRAGSVEQERRMEGGWLIYKCLRGRGGTRDDARVKERGKYSPPKHEQISIFLC